ncbi:MAG: adenosylhomocysteinase, partial [Candidatus Muiribacteriota bacterium]
CTFTGNINVIRKEHIEKMKDNTIICNAGHYNVEIDIVALDDMAKSIDKARNNVTEYVLEDGRRVNLLAEGRIVNMTAAEGHPAAVMDISFSLQLLSLELFLQDDGTLQPNLYEVPEYIDESIANLKLMALGISIDEYTRDQLEYMENN